MNTRAIVASRVRWLLLIFLIVLVGCTERGVRGLEYRWSTQTVWSPDPPARPSGDEEFLVRTEIPDVGPRPAVAIHQASTLVSVEVDGVPIEMRSRWKVKRLPPGCAGKHLVARYHTKYTVPHPVLAFGDEETLAVDEIKDDLPTFSIGVAMLILAFGAAASLLVRMAKPWFYFALFAFSIGMMLVLEAQTLFALYPILPYRDPVHELSIFLIGTGFSGFIGETFEGKWKRMLSNLATSSAVCGAIVVALHVFGVMPGRQLRAVADVHILTAVVFSLMTTIPRRKEPTARVFLIGLVMLVVLTIPSMLSGLNIIDVHTVKWGIALFTLSMGYVLYNQYRAKEHELEKRVKDVEVLNAELRHQVAERSRELARLVTEAHMDQVPDVGKLVAGRYRIVRALGAGGFGRVFEVLRTSDDKRFAMKIMHGGSKVDVARFAREAEIAAKLVHPNVISVADVGLGTWGSPFIVMELVEGGTLADKKYTGDDVGRILLHVARGLLALHQAGIVHRDLKPSNVLISGQEAKLADFGISRATAAPLDATQRELTQEGSFLGTPIYMAPEQSQGADKASPASDVFSFGVMAYQLFSGELPFESPVVFLSMADETLPVPPSFKEFVEDARLRRLLDDSLSTVIEKRPSMKDLVAALESAFGQAS